MLAQPTWTGNSDQLAYRMPPVKSGIHYLFGHDSDPGDQIELGWPLAFPADLSQEEKRAVDAYTKDQLERVMNKRALEEQQYRQAEKKRKGAVAAA